MTYHFENYLQKTKIESVASQFGFTMPVNVEKFIMDFEMNYHISKEIDSTVRGGMCMPFHTNLGVRRLSVDIDLLTKLSTDEIQGIMRNIDGGLDEVTIKKHEPRDPYPIPNLLSYYVEYDSCFGKSDTVKIDFLCGLDLDLPTDKITASREILEFQIDYHSKILTLGALIGDKITTLALGTIGLKETKFYDIPKQIYDIATLLKIATEKNILESFNVFQNFTEFKVKIFRNGMYTPQHIINSIIQSINTFFKFSTALTIADNYDGFYGSFKGTYLNTRQPYNKTQHISDILLVWLFAQCLHKINEKLISKEQGAAYLYQQIDAFKKIIEYDAEQRQRKRQDILSSIPSLPFNKNILNGPPVEQVFLIKEIFI